MAIFDMSYDRKLVSIQRNTVGNISLNFVGDNTREIKDIEFASFTKLLDTYFYISDYLKSLVTKISDKNSNMVCVQCLNEKYFDDIEIDKNRNVHKIEIKGLEELELHLCENHINDLSNDLKKELKKFVNSEKERLEHIIKSLE